MVAYQKATIADLDAVARVHLQAFPGFFLSRLGYGFLREMYRGFVTHVDGVFWIALDEQSKVIGFIAGTTAPHTFFADLRRMRMWYFLWHAIPALLRQPMLVLPKLYGALFYKGDKPKDLTGGVLLSSIGVLPNVVGKSVGQGLLQSFENDIWSKGRQFIYLTTDALNNDKVNKFYQRNGYQIESQFMQSGNRLMFRYIKNAKV